MKYRRPTQANLLSFGRGIILCLIVLWIVFPFLWCLSSAFRPSTELYDMTILPKHWTVQNFVSALRNERFTTTYKNSLIVAVATALLTVSLTSLGAYSLARYRYKGKGLITALLLITQLLPGVLLVVPLFVVFSKLRLVNTYTGLILGFTTFSAPFATILLRNFFANFPVELEEAAWIDGCTRLQALRRIVIPLNLPGIIAAGLFCFVLAWNDLLFALVLSQDTKSMTVAVTIHNVANSQFASTNWSEILAQGSLVSVPIVVLFIVLQGYLVEGLMAGALKS